MVKAVKKEVVKNNNPKKVKNITETKVKLTKTTKKTSPTIEDIKRIKKTPRLNIVGHAVTKEQMNEAIGKGRFVSFYVDNDVTHFLPSKGITAVDLVDIMKHLAKLASEVLWNATCKKG